ncbi:developmental pluripotency-associated protein 2-like [Heptranchias perlo]|uniref:developmental pluripotency-associated protein 2-like n=1 Tax=Heptranchias perlo TaxID=212740 RepID=UPI00355A7592
MAARVSLAAIKSPTRLFQLKRQQLQRLCKKLGLKANGKNVELISRLSEHIQETTAEEAISSSPVLVEEANPPRGAAEGTTAPGDQGEEQRETKDGSGWCVLHGMEIVGRDQIWSSLIAKSGKFLVADGNSLVPLHLTPATVETPAHLEDNQICEECLKLNRIKDSIVRIPTARQYSGDSNSFKNKHLTFDRYYPQEDKGYATKVEKLLLEIEKGDVTVEQAIRSGRPKVVHSP